MQNKFIELFVVFSVLLTDQLIHSSPVLHSVDQLIQSFSGNKKSILDNRWRRADGQLRDSVNSDGITKGTPLVPTPCFSNSVAVANLDTILSNNKVLKFNYYPLLSGFNGNLNYFDNICVYVQVDLDPVYMNTNSVS